MNRLQLKYQVTNWMIEVRDEGKVISIRNSICKKETINNKIRETALLVNSYSLDIIKPFDQYQILTSVGIKHQKPLILSQYSLAHALLIKYTHKKTRWNPLQCQASKYPLSELYCKLLSMKQAKSTSCYGLR